MANWQDLCGDRDPDAQQREIGRRRELGQHETQQEIEARLTEAQQGGASAFELIGYRISSLPSQLAALTDLCYFSCALTQVSNLDPLKTLNSLREVDCSGTRVNELTPLAGLRLQSLKCSGTPVNDLGPLKEHVGLRLLDCSGTPVADLGPLRNLAGLQALNCFGTRVSGLEALHALNELLVLNCSGTLVTDLGPLKDVVSLQELNCAGTQVSSLAPLAKLTNLRKLSCTGTTVADLSPLKSLTSLQWLDFGRTPVCDLAPLSALPALTMVVCSATQVRDLEPLRGLVRLRSLHCATNHLKDLAPLEGLASLRDLYCGNSQVSDLGPVERLIGLENLDCQRSLVTSLEPVRNLKSLRTFSCNWTEVSDLEPLEKLTHLQTLHCLNTKVTARALQNLLRALPELNHLFFESGLGQIPRAVANGQCCRQLREYFAALEGDEKLARDVKLVLVGNGWVGKTTLADRLLGRAPGASGNEDRTHAIAIGEFALPLDGGDSVNVQLWDFGGQEIYHATHRCFLHQRAIYLLLWAEVTDAPDGEGVNEPIRYWLHWISQLASGSPIVLVKNQIDRRNVRALPEGLPHDSKPFLHFCSISAKTGAGVHDWLLPVIRAQVQLLRDRWEYPLPGSWTRVRDELDRLRRQDGTASISKGRFDDVCLQCGLQPSVILLEYLHDTGFLFHKSGVFSDLVVLDQNWFIKAVYRVLDPRPSVDASGRQRRSPRERIIAQRGEFKGTDLPDFWDGSDADCEAYVQFMTQTALAFEVLQQPHGYRSLGDRTFVVPSLLPKVSDAQVSIALAGWPPANTWVVEVEYDFLLRSVLDQMMAWLCQGSVKRHLWATGLLYIDPQSQGRVRLEHAPGKHGGGYLRFELEPCPSSDVVRLDSLRGLLMRLNSVDGPKPKDVWVCPDATQASHSMVSVTVLKVKARSVQSAQVPTRTNDTVAVAGYLVFTQLAFEREEVGERISLRFLRREAPSDTSSSDPNLANSLPTTTEPMSPIKLFVSYSHEDETHLKRFEVCLKNLKNNYPQLEYWHDRKLIPGQGWEANILGELNNANIVCLLVSPHFMASPYCYSTELPLALQQYNSGGGVAVPIIIRKTPGWNRQELGTIQGLPKDAKPISEWKDEDDFWADVTLGLERLIQAIVSDGGPIRRLSNS